MHNYRKEILVAVEETLKAKLKRHQTNIEVLLDSHVGIADHSDIVGTVESQIDTMSIIDGQLNIIEKYLK